MKARLRLFAMRCLLNWRWWLCMPIVLLIICPLGLVSLTFAAISVSLERIDDAFTRVADPLCRVLLRWVMRGRLA